MSFIGILIIINYAPRQLLSDLFTKTATSIPVNH